jgi:hypothetical protein
MNCGVDDESGIAARFWTSNIEGSWCSGTRILDLPGAAPSPIEEGRLRMNCPSVEDANRLKDALVLLVP